jgi:hypothetical protein
MKPTFMSRPPLTARHDPDVACRENSNAMLPMTTVAGVPPFYSGEPLTER